MMNALGDVTWDDNGQPSRMFGSILDITKRKKSEADLAESQKNLQRMQKLETLGILSGGIAHEFNNVLTAYWEIDIAKQKTDSSPLPPL